MDWLDWICGWWFVPDKLLKEKAKAVFCHTYSAAQDLSRLTKMSQATMKKAIELIVNNKAQYLIVALGWYGEAEEKKIRQEMVERAGISDKTFFLRAVTSTYDEVYKAEAVLNQLNAYSVIVVAERYHMRRSLRIFRSVLTGIKFYNVSVKAGYENPAHGPGLATYTQSMQLRTKLVSIAWNMLFYVLTPIMIKGRKSEIRR